MKLSDRYLISLVALMVAQGTTLCVLSKVQATIARPCLATKPPVRVQMDTLYGPEPISYVDEDGSPMHGMVMAIEPASLKAFLSYVTTLETLAQQAAACHR